MFKPFSAGDVLRLKTGADDLEIESSESGVSFMSDFDITRDKAGLQFATELRGLLEQVVQRLVEDEQAGTLPTKLAKVPPTMKANPLG